VSVAHTKPTLDDSLPDPELNPLINPCLGKNLGRWADVYYSAPPDQREAAGRNLVRELEHGAHVPPRGCEPVKQTLNAVVPAVPTLKPTPATPNFCVKCGSRLHGEKTEQPEPSADAAASAAIEEQEVEIAPTQEIPPKRSRFRMHVVIVLTLSCAIAVWALRLIGADYEMQTFPALTLPFSTSAPPSPTVATSSSARISRAATPPATTSHLPPVVKVQPKSIRPGIARTKPAAGKPFSCRADALASCTANELRHKTLAVAAGIDELYLGQNRRTRQLLREANARGDDRRMPARLREANYSLHLWEQLRLTSYQKHERRDATLYRTELLRRLAAADESRNRRMYDHPQSCLHLHLIAEDLRRLAARLPERRENRP
jgi:hypothetical protein